MSKITVLVHPTGKVWATHEIGGKTELCFGKTAFVEQDHPAGYTQAKLSEKLKKGYVALLDGVDISEAALYSLKTLCQTCQQIVLHRGSIFGHDQDVFIQLAAHEQRRLIRALEMQFSLLPGQIGKLQEQMQMRHLLPARDPVLAVKPADPAGSLAPAGPWSW